MSCSDLSFIPTIDLLVVGLRKAHIPQVGCCFAYSYVLIQNRKIKY
jgi:hypothetical protein